MASAGEKIADQRIERASQTGSMRSGEPTNDKEAGADLLQAQQVAAQWTDGGVDEKKLVRKLDWRILPCTWVLYLLGYLDR